MKISVADRDQIAQSRIVWDVLVNSMKYPSVFLTWEWVTTWIDQFGSTYDLLVLMGYEGERLVGILPLAGTRVKLEDGLLEHKVITFCGALELYPDHLDVICDRNTSHEKIQSYINQFMEFLKLHNRRSIIYFPFLAERGHLSRWLQQNSYRHRTIVRDDITSPYIPFGEDIDTYFQMMGKKKRYNIKREARILFEQKKVKMAILRKGDEIEKGLDELFRLHSARSSSKGIESTFSSDKIKEYHVLFAHETASLEWVMIFQLLDGNNVIASAYGLLFHGTFNYYQAGFDPEWSHYSPGNVLIYSMIGYLSDKGIKVFDFLGGNDGYKLFWTKEHHIMKNFIIYNGGFDAYLEFAFLATRKFVKDVVSRISLLIS